MFTWKEGGEPPFSRRSTNDDPILKRILRTVRERMSKPDMPAESNITPHAPPGFDAWTYPENPRQFGDPQDDLDISSDPDASPSGESISVEIKAMTDAAGTFPRLRARHVMIIDDNEINRIIMAMNLQELGIRVSLASKGYDAITSLISGEDLPDLIFVDRDMPSPSGAQTARIIRGHPDIPDIPIIGISAFVDCQQTKEMKDAGATTLLQKPIDTDKILSILAPPERKHHDTDFHLGPETRRKAMRELKDLTGELSGLLKSGRNIPHDHAASLAHKIAGVLATCGKMKGYRMMIDMETTFRRGMGCPPEAARWVSTLVTDMDLRDADA